MVWRHDAMPSKCSTDMRKSLPYALLLLAWLASGCVETIVMDPHEKDLPVVIHCVLSNPTDKVVFGTDSASVASTRQKQTVTIKYAKGKSEKGYTPVEEAVVLINASDSLNGTEGTMRFVYAGDGIWESESAVRILPDTKYTLRVRIPGRDEIRAETVSHPQVSPGLYFPDYYLKLSSSEKEELLIKHPFSFNKTSDNPVWVFAQGFTPDGWKDLKYIVTDNPYADDFNVIGQHFSGLTILGKQDMDDDTDARLRFVFEKSREFNPDLPLHQGYLRIGKMEDQTPFFMYAGPVWFQNLEANGYYGMYDEWVSDWEIDLETLERTPIYKKVGWKWNKYFRFCFHFVNPDLDEYLRSVYLQEEKSTSYLTELYSTANTFTNIHGGLGIFGCDYWINVVFREPGDYAMINEPVSDF